MSKRHPAPMSDEVFERHMLRAVRWAQNRVWLRDDRAARIDRERRLWALLREQRRRTRALRKQLTDNAPEQGGEE